MPEVIEQQEQTIDVAAHIAHRNAAEQAKREGKPVPEAPKPVEVAKPTGEATKPEEKPHISRSARRAINQAREEAAELRGELNAYRALGLKPKEAGEPAKEDDPEPQGDPSDPAHIRALARWEGRQEARKELSKRDEQTVDAKKTEEFKEILKAADKKADEDIPKIPDWQAVIDAGSADDSPRVSQGSQLFMMIAASDLRAFALYHFAKHPAELQALIDLESSPIRQIEKFKRLEGRLEVMYTAEQKQEAAQASAGEPAKDRTHPAEAATAGRNASERDARKPRPSSEVAAQGGSAPPDEPKPGTAAWIAMRNERQYGRRA